MTEQIIVCDDCRNVDPSFCQVMITDPPYRAHVHKSAVSQSPNRGVREREFGFEHLTGSLRRHIAGVAATLPRWSIIYSDIESLWLWRLSLEAHGAKYIRPLPWVRWSMPQLSGDRPPSGCEMLTVAWGTQGGSKKPHWHGPGNLTHLAHLCLRGEDKHKAEKPLDQALDLVSWFSDPGDWVYDPFAGRGTFGLACKILGRNYIGVEQNRTEAELAQARIASYPNWVYGRDCERYGRYERGESWRGKAKEE